MSKIKKTYLLFILFFIFTIQPSLILADTGIDSPSSEADILDDFVDSDDFESFESSEIFQEEKINNFTLPSFIQFNGDITFSLVDNISHDSPETGKTDWRGLSRLKTELFLELDIDLAASWKAKVSGNGFYDAVYSLNGRNEYEGELLDEDETGAEFLKAWISGKIADGLDIKAGRQLVVWGKSDNLRVTDVLNPVNLKIPGITDLEDIRIPLLMTRLDYYLGSFSLSAVALHERRFNATPEKGSDFNYYNRVTDLIPTAVISEYEPTEHSSDTEYGICLGGTFTGWDASLYYADFYDKQPYFNIIAFPNSYGLNYSRQVMIGADINIASGNYLIKAESAYFKNVNLSDFMNQLELIVMQKRYEKIKTLLGLEYSGFNNTTISIERMQTYIRGMDRLAEKTEISKNSFETAVRTTCTFWNEKFDTTLLALLYGKKMDEGSLVRFSADYDITDKIIVTSGTVLYDGDEMKLLESFRKNDRVYLNFEYTF